LAAVIAAGKRDFKKGDTITVRNILIHLALLAALFARLLTRKLPRNLANIRRLRSI
jgi:hypothetical protein